MADSTLIAPCGLYCGSCRAYLKGKCLGCKNNEKATWCTIRQCNNENNYRSCADCQLYSNPKECKKFNNFMGKLFGFLFNSDRVACVAKIKNDGYENYALYMAEHQFHTIKRK